MRVWNTVANVATGVVMATSVLAAIVVIRREFTARPAVATPPSSAPREVKGWETWAANGRLVGRADAGVRLIEFADFQCPACNGLEQMLLRFRKDYPEDLAVSYHYVPLEYHKRAYEAARAAECASDQDHFAEMHDAIFKHFSGLDTLSFKSVAQEAGVPNLAEFAKCAARTDSVPRINADRALALDTLQIRGTPSVVVNGMLYNFSPSVGEITKLLKDARARRLAKNGIASN